MVEPTRREFLIGSAVTVVLVSAGLIEGCSRGSPRPATGPSAQLTSTPAGAIRVVSDRMASAHMKSPVSWTVAWPAGGAHGVVYCLHGHGNDHRFPFDQIHLPEVMAASGAPLAVAAVDGGTDSYWHRRADGTDALAMLLDEFIPMVDRQVPGPARRALLGWSMGGYGALLAAEQAPDRFMAVAVASPALWTSPGATAPGAFDSPDDYRRFDVFGGTDRLTGISVRVDCGTGDPFYAATRRFVARLPPGHQGRFGPGAHTSAYWRSIAPAQIATIAAVLAPTA